jgi:hypothetical protein
VKQIYLIKPIPKKGREKEREKIRRGGVGGG